MKLMKTVKKILALSTGAVMVGATVLSAGAANLNEYPAPWVQNGKFNGLIVVGDNPGTSPADVLGAIDIATTLQFATRVPVRGVQSTGGKTSTFSAVGEAWQVENLEVSERGTGVNESISDVDNEIGSKEMGILLADGTLQSYDGDYDYKQKLFFDAGQATGTDIGKSRTVVFAERNNVKYEDDYPDASSTDLFFYIQSGDQIVRYVLDFEGSADSKVTNLEEDVGLGSKLLNFEAQQIEILGKNWDIIEADAINKVTVDGVTAYAGVALTLVGGARYERLSEGETATVYGCCR